MHIISVSRRTDVPAFYAPWWMNRLRVGSVSYPNPYSGKMHTVSLRPEDVHSIVFWSKHYAPLFPYLDEMEEQGYRFYCHYTITGAPRELEPHVPRWEEAAQVFGELARRIGPRQVLWRFDPISPTGLTSPSCSPPERSVAVWPAGTLACTIRVGMGVPTATPIRTTRWP